jgi:hypothetical protein
MHHSKTGRCVNRKICGRGLRPRFRIASWIASSSHADSASETPPTICVCKASVALNLFFIAALMVCAVGCADHPPLERPSYDLAKALYAVCNRQSTEHLAKFDEVLAESIAAGKVGAEEEAALRQIAQEAAAGQWHDAQEMARELLASQNS